jgi:2-keto-4-pentenoate hydratase/2-oxohepta-3-ene-1,7-dioic acid hydratase in catechol pathway
MRLCRFIARGRTSVGFYFDTFVVPLEQALRQHAETTHQQLTVPDGDCLLPFLPHGSASEAGRTLAGWIERQGNGLAEQARVPVADVQLLVPIPRPNKLFLLAGNYADHIREGGGVATERTQTFPYVFMKPPTTTLNDPGHPVVIPAVSPAAIDWELELAVIIGRRCKGVPEAEALQNVAGYTIVNDISNRKFRPNPARRQREKDAFFDWLHGKWHDSFCPCGPCVASADAIADPQDLTLQLRLNGELRQNSSTAQQIFPVAALIEFLSSFVTLEPGDMISTGTPAGVGNTTGTYLQPGDRLEGTISQIGTLISPVVAEPAG